MEVSTLAFIGTLGEDGSLACGWAESSSVAAVCQCWWRAVWLGWWGGVSDSQPWSCLWEKLCPTALAYSSLTHLKCGKGRQKQRKRKQQGRESGKEGGEEESRVGEQGGTLDGACAGD